MRKSDCREECGSSRKGRSSEKPWVGRIHSVWEENWRALRLQLLVGENQCGKLEGHSPGGILQLHMRTLDIF